MKKKTDLVINAKKMHDGSEMIIDASKNKIFLLHDPPSDDYFQYVSTTDVLINNRNKADEILDLNLVEKCFYKDPLKRLYEF